MYGDWQALQLSPRFSSFRYVKSKNEHTSKIARALKRTDAQLVVLRDCWKLVHPNRRVDKATEHVARGRCRQQL